MDDTSPKLSVLVVEDDEDALFIIRQILSRSGYHGLSANSAQRALERFTTDSIDVVIADIGIPDQSGLELLRWVRREQPAAEVIILTGNPSVETAIQALRDGAADYLTKPITADVLAASLRRVEDRIRQAQQRRQALTLLEAGLRHFTLGPGAASARELPASTPLHHPDVKQYWIGPVLLDLDRFVIEVNGEQVHATPSEIEILHYLCRHPGRVITPQEMVQSIRGYRVEPHQAPEIIRPHISNLRRKLLAAAPQADVVRTVRGVGYMLQVPQQNTASEQE